MLWYTFTGIALFKVEKFTGLDRFIFLFNVTYQSGMLNDSISILITQDNEIFVFKVDHLRCTVTINKNRECFTILWKQTC